MTKKQLIEQYNTTNPYNSKIPDEHSNRILTSNSIISDFKIEDNKISGEVYDSLEQWAENLIITTMIADQKTMSEIKATLEKIDLTVYAEHLLENHKIVELAMYDDKEELPFTNQKKKSFKR